MTTPTASGYLTDTSREDRRAMQCEGKIRFASPQLAQQAAKRQAGRDHYRCKHCGGWHVGGNWAVKGRKRR